MNWLLPIYGEVSAQPTEGLVDNQKCADDRLETQPADGPDPQRRGDSRRCHRARLRRPVRRLRAGADPGRPRAVGVQRPLRRYGLTRARLAAFSTRRLLRLQRDGPQRRRRHARARSRAGRRPRGFPLRAWTEAGAQPVGDGGGRRALHRHALQLLPASLHLEAKRPGVDAVHDLRRDRQRRCRAPRGQSHRPPSILCRDQPEQDGGGGERGGRGRGGGHGGRRVGGPGDLSTTRPRARGSRRRQRRDRGPGRVADEATRRREGLVPSHPRTRRRPRPTRLDPVPAHPRVPVRDALPSFDMTRPINVAVLGATGSIGRQTLDVIDRNPGRFRLFGLTEGIRSTNREADYLVQGHAGEPEFDARVESMVTDPRCDVVVVAIPGARALGPTLSALHAGKDVALATKEVLVMAGALVMKAAAGRAQGALPEIKGIRPIDSEHSAIWQCLWGERRENVRRLILTASGGPFWAHPDLDLDQVTVEQALNHPRWSMGPKVTVDSATLMNKGLELIEAHHLFGIPLDAISVCIHPQSVVQDRKSVV